MARKSLSRTLHLWSNGIRLGEWHLPARGDMELTYDRQWVESPLGRPLSLSLPFTIGNQPLRGERVLNYFDNLLPDSDAIRRRIASRFRTGSTQAFRLLQALGRDCVGAIQLLPENETPVGFDRIEGTALSGNEVEAYLQRVVAAPAGLGQEPEDDDDFRFSLAGAQEKAALLWHNNTWMRPHGATPTTHILKLPMGLIGNNNAIDVGASVENEWLCSRILQAYGLPVAPCEILDFGSQRVLAVTRFDRQLHPSGTWWMRLPQEDFCQVTGTSPDKKYESNGGPGIRTICNYLGNSITAQADLEVFMKAMVLFWMLAAPDGHAKNFSLRLLPGGRYQLTPLYDVLSIWPVEGPKQSQLSWQKASMAMAVWGKSRHYRFIQVQRRHFNAMAPVCGLGPNMEPLIESIIAATPEVIARVKAQLPKGFSAQVADSILGNLQSLADLLEAMPPA